MSNEPIGVGIIGANVSYGWGTRAHLPALQALPEFDVVAVCTTRMATASETAARFDIPNALDDVEALVERPDVELVLVCVRVPLHHELTSAALNAGKHVFTEWPLGANLTETRELRDLAESTGVRHMVGLQARAAPAFVRMRQLIEEGFVGEVLTATMRSTSPGARVRRQSFAWAVDATQGATTLSIAAGHALDALTFCLGEFRSVSGTVATQVRSIPGEEGDDQLAVTSPDTVLVSGELESGAVVAAAIRSVPTHGSGFTFEVHGSGGTLVLESPGIAQIAELTLKGARSSDPELTELPLPTDSRWVPEELEGPPLNVAQLLRRLGESIRGNGAVGPDFNHAVRRHELLDAIERASDTGARQSLT